MHWLLIVERSKSKSWVEVIRILQKAVHIYIMDGLSLYIGIVLISKIKNKINSISAFSSYFGGYASKRLEYHYIRRSDNAYTE